VNHGPFKGPSSYHRLCRWWLIAELAANPTFVAFWGTAILWKETSRYEQKTQPEADALYLAITANANGVLRGIRNYW
jgi:hypothetical protein